MPPGLSYEAAGERISAGIPVGVVLAAFRHRVARDSPILEERSGVVKDEPGVHFQLGDPAGRRRVAIEVDFAGAGGAEIVRETLKFERRAAANGERTFQQRLKRYNDRLPAENLIFFFGRGQTCGRATIYTAGYLIEPTMRNVLAAKTAGITLAPKPAGINKEPLREVDL
jgi:hypothetical protein